MHLLRWDGNSREEGDVKERRYVKKKISWTVVDCIIYKWTNKHSWFVIKTEKVNNEGGILDLFTNPPIWWVNYKQPIYLIFVWVYSKSVFFLTLRLYTILYLLGIFVLQFTSCSLSFPVYKNKHTLQVLSV